MPDLDGFAFALVLYLTLSLAVSLLVAQILRGAK